MNLGAMKKRNPMPLPPPEDVIFDVKEITCTIELDE